MEEQIRPPAAKWLIPRTAISPRDRKSHARYDEYVDYYAVKHAIAHEVQPIRILEIGVRAGYSALAFLTACPDAKYVGLDAENGKHGGADGPWLPWAEKLLLPYHAKLVKVDTQTLTSLDYGMFDLVHVDGDHTFAGALHDLELCWPYVNPGGLMLVDDYDYLAPVRRAVDAFEQAHQRDYELVRPRVEYRKSLRGERLFWRPLDLCMR